MINPDRAQAHVNLIKNLAREQLKGRLTVGGLTDITDRTLVSAEAEIGEWFANLPTHLPRPQCRGGCSACCFQLVAVTAPEVILLVRRLKERQPKALVATLAERVAAIANLTRGMSEIERNDCEEPCPFLHASQCLIYPYRPLACLSTYSLDAKACGSWMDDNAPILVPFIGEPGEVASLLRHALHAALLPFKVKLAWLDFFQAIHIALTDQSAPSRWCKGEDAFAGAQIPWMVSTDHALLARAATGDSKAQKICREKCQDQPRLPTKKIW